MIFIKHKKCDECGTCISVCKSDALVLGKKLYVQADKCASCGVCINICPFNAITAGTAAKQTNGEPTP